MHQGESELQMVQRHVREGEAILERQHAIISRLSELHLPIDRAQELLVTFERMQSLHLAHLSRILTLA